jgi:pyridoxamine 5'-phosphate oxidase
MHGEDTRKGLAEGDVDPDPVVQFGRWLADAQAAGLVEPTATTLATATADGRPSARMVLLRGVDQRGFVFYTNYESRKAAELAANPRAALVFWWGELQRQVRVEGRVEKTSLEESAAYFSTRPLGSRLSAWASPQSQAIPDRAVLERRVAELAAAYPGGDVPLPPFWGGYRLVHEVVELWHGRPNRLHDRLRYTRAPGGGWRIERLAP